MARGLTDVCGQRHRRNELRRAHQCGMVAASPVIALCSNCGHSVASSDIYNDWCPSCVLHWGHPDDAAELVCGSPKQAEQAIQYLHAIHHNTAPSSTPSMILAIQSFGAVNTEGTYCPGDVLIERSRATASDGFLFEDNRRPGRMFPEVRLELWKATEKLFVAGFSNNAVCRVMGLDGRTIRRWRKEHYPKVFTCECGDVATHQFWCWARFRGSRLRQELLQRWHAKARFIYEPKDGFAIAYTNAASPLQV